MEWKHHKSVIRCFCLRGAASFREYQFPPNTVAHTVLGTIQGSRLSSFDVWYPSTAKVTLRCHWDRISSYRRVHLAGYVLCGDQSCRHLRGANLWIRRGDRKEFSLSEFPDRKKKRTLLYLYFQVRPFFIAFVQNIMQFCILLCLKVCKLAKVCHVLFFCFAFGHRNSSPIFSFLCLNEQEKEVWVWRMSFSEGAQTSCSALNNFEAPCFRLV